MGRRISNEVLIAGLLVHGSIRETAKEMKIGERTIRERMKEPGFAEEYQRARADVLAGSVHRLTSRIGTAADVLADIMEDTNTAPAVRVSAARSVLEYAGRLSVREMDSRADDGRLAELIDGLKYEEDPLSAALRAEAERLMREREDSDAEEL